MGYKANANALRYLKEQGISYQAYVLAHTVFVVEIGDFPMHKNERIAARLLENHHSYLFALQDNDHFRQFATRLPFRLLRKLMIKARGANVSE